VPAICHAGGKGGEMKPDRRANLCSELYDALIVALRYRARACGYAIAVHGSLKRDIDLIACPWRSHAISAADLISNLEKVIIAVTGTVRYRIEDSNPLKMPCGRLAWSIYLTPDDHDPYLDISVMPALEEK
jgi:hypothetical protein